MSYDLILWRGTPKGGEDLAWSRLRSGETVPGLAPFAVDEVIAAFRAACRGQLKVEGAALDGGDFTLHVDEGAQFLHVTGAWSAASDAGARSIRDAARRLDATVFDPQLAKAPPLRARSIVAAVEWGDGRPYQGELPAERASSLAGVTLSTVPPDRGPLLDQMHELCVRETAGRVTGVAHLERTCTFARFAPGILPFEVVAGRTFAAQGDHKLVLGQALLGAFEQQVGRLVPPAKTVAVEDNKVVSTWKGIGLEPAGPAHDALGSRVDLTPAWTASARAVLAQAHAGDTRPVRTWLAMMAAIDVEGRAAIEHGPVEIHEAGAVMQLWAQHPFSPRIVEARLRVTERGVQLRLVTLDADAPGRALPPPLDR